MISKMEAQNAVRACHSEHIRLVAKIRAMEAKIGAMEEQLKCKDDKIADLTAKLASIGNPDDGDMAYTYEELLDEFYESKEARREARAIIDPLRQAMADGCTDVKNMQVDLEHAMEWMPLDGEEVAK